MNGQPNLAACAPKDRLFALAYLLLLGFRIDFQDEDRPVARQLSPRYDRSISWSTATIGAWLPRIESAAAPA